MVDFGVSNKELVWLHGEIKTPPFSEEARRKVGFLLRHLQRGHPLGMPNSRPMPSIGPHCHELRVQDSAAGVTWRIIYRIDGRAILISEVFAKKTRKTPRDVIESCQRRFAQHDQDNR